MSLVVRRCCRPTFTFAATALLGLVAGLGVGCSGSSPSDLFGNASLEPLDGGSDDSSMTPDTGAGDGDGGAPESGARDTGPGVCATAGKLKDQAPYIELLADGSGSMTGAYADVLTTIPAFLTDFSQPGGERAIGLMGFSDSNDPTGGDGPYPTSADVAPSAISAAQTTAVQTRMTGANPNGPSPNLLAIKAAIGAIQGFAPAANWPQKGARIVVFLTDGQEGTAGGNETQQTRAAVAQAAAKGIRVLPVAFPASSPPSATYLDNLAKAGGVAKAGCGGAANPCYLSLPKPPTNASSLILAAINELRAPDPCDIPLDISGAINIAAVDVVFTSGSDVTRFAASTSNGYTFDDLANPKRVLLQGPACTLVTGDPKGKLSISATCK